MGLSHATCNSKMRLEGKTAVITGANGGIGKETARDFYGRGARVILACRNIKKGKEAVEDIKNNPPSGIKKSEYQKGAGELEIYSLDLCSLKSVRDCAKRLLEKEMAIHILVNNAGIMMSPYALTEDGFEEQLQTNYLSHFLLTLLLLPKIRLSAPGCRIVNLASILNFFGNIYFDDINLTNSCLPLKRYGQSKTANILFTRELARRLREAEIGGINVYSLHPGVVSTELGRNLNRTIIPGAAYFYQFIMRPFVKTVEQGAQTTIYCSVDENAANETGLYYRECRPVTTLRRRSDQMAKDLWDFTCKLLHLEPDENFDIFLNNVSRQIAE